MCLNFGLHVNLWNLLLWSQVGIESPLLLEVLFGFSSRGIFLLDYLWLNKNVFQMVSSLSLNHMIPVTFSVLDTPQITICFMWIRCAELPEWPHPYTFSYTFTFLIIYTWYCLMGKWINKNDKLIHLSIKHLTIPT